MRARDHYWTIALCLSMTAHAAFIEWRACKYIEDHTPIRTGGYGLASAGFLQQSSLEPDEVPLGQADGVGKATDASPGDEPLQARLGEQDQSFLSRDPDGPGKIGSAPSQSVVPPGENGAAGTGESAAAFGVQPREETAPRPAFDTHRPAQPPQSIAAGSGPELPQPPVHALLALTTPAVQPAAASRKASASSDLPAGTPGPNAPAADPAPQGESESDPFSTSGAAEFRRGSTKVQLGRAHKITRPRLPWDTLYDLIGMTGCACTLDLQIDETGHVINVTVLRSSGSDSIDQPCRLAAYDWWFEPAKDASGKPIKDEIKFTLKFL